MSGASHPTVLVMVLDAIGVPTIEHLLRHYDGEVRLPNLYQLGLGNVLGDAFHRRIPPNQNAQFAVAIDQASASADSVIGHREMVGVVDPRTYELFYEGFPADYLAALEKAIGSPVMFNKRCGGEVAIEQNWREHKRTGYPIVYASVCDPLLQIAMDEDVIPVEDQHNIGDEAFHLAMRMGVPLTRVIVRPYKVLPGDRIVRTNNRHDVVLPLEQETLVDILHNAGIHTTAVAKVGDLVTTSRFQEKVKVTGRDGLDDRMDWQFIHPDGKDTNPYSLQSTVNALVTARRHNGAFVFSNLVDTDTVYGHTRDIPGAVRCLEEIDRCLPTVRRHMIKGDILIITGDHGMEHRPDYGYHHKERVPLLATRVGEERLGLRAGNGRTFADVGYLVAQAFGQERAFVERCNISQYLPH